MMAFYTGSQNPFGIPGGPNPQYNRPSVMGQTMNRPQQPAAWQQPGAGAGGARPPQQQAPNPWPNLAQQQSIPLSFMSNLGNFAPPTPDSFSAGWAPPMLTPPISLQDLAGINVDFPTGGYGGGMPAGAGGGIAPSAAGAAPSLAALLSQPGQPQQGAQARGPMMLSSGISPPASPQLPSAPPTPAGIPGMGGGGYRGNLAQALASRFMPMQGQQMQNQAALDMAGQQAQAQSGQQWGSLANAIQNLMYQQQLGQQGLGLGLAGALMGGMA